MLNLAIILGIGLLVGAWVLSPLFSSEDVREEKNASGDSLADLYLEKQRAYESLRDCDFDYHTGKLSESDYRNLRDRFRREAIAALKKLEGRGGSTSPISPPGDPEES